MPRRRFGVFARLPASAALHLTVFMLAASVKFTPVPGIDPRHLGSVASQETLDVRHIVFLAPDPRRIGGGGGGGGNQQPGPVRRAQGVGSDEITLRMRKSLPATAPLPGDSRAPLEEIPSLPSIVLDAMPLASGTFDQIGLPIGGVPSGISTGPGSGGGVGTGRGTGIGSGSGPGLGSGSGGGIGGGVYRAGGVATPPRVITEVRASYTNDALLHRIQGTVELEVIVTSEGRPSHIRVVRSLDPEGLDDQAVAAVAQWRFEPGRVAGKPVNVLVTIMLDFTIR
jgi:TonB family protein